jgi:hypothetical protein
LNLKRTTVLFIIEFSAAYSIDLSGRVALITGASNSWVPVTEPWRLPETAISANGPARQTS